MSTKRRWYEILLPGMVILLVLAAGTVRTANAWQYELDEEPYTYESDDYDRNTSTYVEFAEATATASNGECYCKTSEGLTCSKGAYRKRLKRARNRLMELLAPFFTDEEKRKKG